MKDKTTPNNAQLEQWLQQDLPDDNPSPDLQEKLLRIPEQFPRAANVTAHESVQKSARESERENRLLYPLLVTAASVVGIIAGSLDLLAVLPEQDLLTALLYGTPDLNGIAL